MAAITRILVPLDLGESSERTLDYARTLARPFHASLHLMHVVPNPYVTMASEAYMPPPQDFLDDLETEARNRLKALLTDDDHAAFKAETLVVVGDPLCAIVDHATAGKIDLIVMGTHGRTGVAHLMLGSVAERVVRTAPCPVLTIR
jgi:nucleotide-binding universal stress UspA family protein